MTRTGWFLVTVVVFLAIEFGLLGYCLRVIP